jgi:hypothetical protein
MSLQDTHTNCETLVKRNEVRVHSFNDIRSYPGSCKLRVCRQQNYTEIAGNRLVQNPEPPEQQCAYLARSII